MEHAPELDAVSGLDAVVLGPEAPEDAARRALRVPTLEHHVADPDAYLELYERHSWARRRGHGPPMLEGRPFFHEREVDDWQRPMACSVVVRAGAARVLRRDGAGAASRWAWRPGPEDRWVVPTALLAARDPGPFDPAEDAEQPGGELVRCPCCREDLAPVLRQTSKPGDASPGLSLWRQLASYGAWCPGCRRGFAMRDAVVLDRPLLPYVSAYDLPRGHLLERPGATYVRFEDDRHRVPAGTRLLVCPEPVDARVLAEAGAGRGVAAAVFGPPGRRRGPGDADRAPARWREALALEAAADARRRDAQAATRAANAARAALRQARFVLCDANAESAVVAEFKAAVLAWTAALLERAAASPGAPDWKGLLGAAERAFDDRVRRKFAAWKFRSRLLVEWCAAADGPFELLERHTAARAARVLARRATRQRVVRAALPVRPAVAVADFLCGDARAIEVRVFAEHFLLGSFLHRKLASALGLLGARVTTFCTRLSAFASTYVAARPRVDFDGVLAKNKTTLSKRACAAVLRCDKRHRY